MKITPPTVYYYVVVAALMVIGVVIWKSFIESNQLLARIKKS